MKRQLLTGFVIVLFAMAVTAMATPIRDIQYTEDASGDSPLSGQEVTITGIISGEPYAFGSSYYVQDANEPWSGIMVYDPDREAAEGDLVTLTGTVSEYWGMTQIGNVTAFSIDSTGVGGLEPMLVTTGEIATDGDSAEAYEGCLVRVEDADITNPALGYGEWEIDDGTGACRVDDAADYFFNPDDHAAVKSVTGILNYAHGDTKIEPRLAYDVVEAGEYTRLQRIQQVRYSDLLKTPEDHISDTSYLDQDTVTVKGVVTMPTGLSYAGEGIKFIFSEPEGGPWSAILSYHPDSTSYPQLYEGDVITMTGYLDEYATDVSNMTEFWITSPINVVDFGQPVPEPDSIATGDLRWPTTAEQWGTVMVEVGDATVVDVNPAFELFAVDDGTGSILVDDDSDSLEDYTVPPLGTIAESIEGWVYHHYGTYVDSSAYKLEPLYTEDIIWGVGPPAVENTARSIAAPTSTDAVTVTTEVATNLEISSVTLYYSVDGGTYEDVQMTDQGDGTWTGEIPAQAADSFVSYYVKATDSEDQSTTAPADIEALNFSYVVKDGPLTIADIQYTPWEMATSPFEGQSVEVTGIVTVDSAYYNDYEGYVIQDAEGAWNGVYLFGSMPTMLRGDQVKVYGTVTDYNADWHFKWDNNTTILVDSAEVLSTGNDLPAITTVTTGDLADKTETAESFEGTLVRVENATITAVNSYDVSLDDGSGACLLDADGLIAGDNDPNPVFFIDSDNEQVVVNGTDTLKVGDQVSFAQGVLTFSFGTHKIELRDLNDVGVVTGVKDDVVARPLNYRLAQNYPNPFNPETRIFFEIPASHQVKVVIYNMLGQQVRTLVDEQMNAGRHTVNWDGLNNQGTRVPTGMYIYRIKAGDFIASKKMMLIK